MIGPLSWVLIYVSDIDKTRHFYEKILDLPLKSVRPQIIVFRTGACTLELMAKLDNGPQPSEMDDADRKSVV
jgi:catechol 2,3-dioxygenase-like lactoylglutathione lyase family enzyme